MDSTFIVGVGRSGTSLLQSMLAAHSQIAFPPETAFMRRYVARGAITGELDRKGTGAVADMLAGDEYFQRTSLDARELVQRVGEKGHITDGAVYREMLRVAADRQEKARAGDKDPRSVEFLGLVLRVLGNCHVVHVIRDPRDVLASKKKAEWSRGRGILRHVFANRLQIKMGRADGPRLFGKRYQEVIYEKLLEKPDEELRKLCEGLGVDYEPSMLDDFGQSARRLVSEKEMSWKKETLGPLLVNNHGKWKNSLNDREAALVELVCKEHFAAGGYEKSGCIKNLPLGEKLKLHAMAAVIIWADPFYRAYRKWTIRRAEKFA